VAYSAWTWRQALAEETADGGEDGEGETPFDGPRAGASGEEWERPEA
jgi:hypothetical protein